MRASRNLNLETIIEPGQKKCVNKKLTFIYNKFLFIVHVSFLDRREALPYNEHQKQKGGGAVDERRKELARETLRLLPLLFRRLFQTSRRTALPDLPPTQLQTLMLLERAEGQANMTWLAEELCISRQQLTKVANCLEDRGFVRREQSAENRRMVFLTLTDLGRQAMQSVLCEALSTLEHSFESYSGEELDALIDASKIMQRHLENDRRQEG